MSYKKKIKKYNRKKKEKPLCQVYFCSFFMTKTSDIFFIGGRVRPQICYFLLFIDFFSVEKYRLFACLFTQLKGRTGEPKTAPEGYR